MKAFILISLYLLPSVGFAQFGQNKANVVAIEGLNIRLKPDKSSVIVHKAPYLAEVEILETQDPKVDTIMFYTFYGQNRSYIDHVNGAWLRIRFQNYEGYAFSGYLIKLNDDYFKSESLNNAFGINFIGSNCFDNVHRNKNIKWKGLYRNGDRFLIKDIKLRYYNDFQEVTAFKTTTETNKDLLFAFGSESDLFKNGEVRGEFHYWNSGKILKDYSRDINFEYFETIKKPEEVLLVLKSNGKKQVLNSQMGGWPNTLRWKGDLDGDGEDDYIIMYGDKGASIVLYLSSEAEEGEIIKAVAIFYSGYCC